LFFELIQTDPLTRARAGLIRTDHGDVETPVFMPVGTHGAVKTVSPHDLEDLGARILLANTYHLYLRPGEALVRKAGGLHRFIGWPRPILTDSGGFQVFSLSDLRTVNDDGVTFRSHLDGSSHRFTPEKAVDIQTALGSDIQMVLDECVGFPSDEKMTAGAHQRTLRWAERCRTRFLAVQDGIGWSGYQFGIAQGGIYPGIRKDSARRLVEMGFDGYAVGGLAVGEPGTLRNEMTALCTEIFPAAKPRYLMGVGKPEDIVESIGLGIDMFDCVIPTRNGRNGTVYTRNGKMIIKNKTFERDFRPIDDGCGCYTCRCFHRAYLRHLLHSGEMLGQRLTTIHNLYFFMKLVREAREAVLQSGFSAWKNAFFDVYYGRDRQ
jgi:queuine tRNA-ribosyltransferase